ncbi:MAG: 4-alpha-glucanotransferase, partial [Chloroflexota bacterium]
MQFPRSSGVLLHPTSLPSKFGIGDFGESAYQFVDFLVESKQSLWQLLPLGPTGYGDSPYQSFSSFAGNPLLISPQKLVDQGLLPETAVQYVPNFPKNEADFGPVIPYKLGLLKQSFETFESKGTAVQREALDVFCNAQSAWLDDFAFFMALKNHHVEQEGGVWNTWPKDIAMRHPEAMQRWAEKLTLEIRFHKYLQFLFFEQWLALKAYANQNGIQIVGDIPIFVAFDSADVWANRELFFLDEAGNPTVVAGVPPDYFSETGQRWGNPLYNWDKLAKDNYGWWAKRLKMCFVLAD